MEEYNRQIRENAQRNYQKLDIQEAEAAGAARDQLLDSNLDMVRQRAQIESIAAATGTAGGTLNTLINDEAEDVRRGAQAQLKSTSIQKPTAGEWLSIAAKGATDMYSGVNNGLKMNGELGSNWTINGRLSKASSGANTKVN
ncbi:hypothetical protein GH714_043927 [Hevea brasiliensis]|uniref:Uncharacterized protein n=1 Tax=Hevea brasiliensis TaxID=3981 RepID=A0A6A6K324_HEVBR|nr:hypothetical protein GH714_043927 [Hevea brasiliensis]